MRTLQFVAVGVVAAVLTLQTVKKVLQEIKK